MRITYLQDGTPVPVFEPGDFVRLLRDEPGDPVVTVVLTSPCETPCCDDAVSALRHAAEAAL